MCFVFVIHRISVIVPCNHVQQTLLFFSNGNAAFCLPDIYLNSDVFPRWEGTFWVELQPNISSRCTQRSDPQERHGTLAVSKALETDFFSVLVILPRSHTNMFSGGGLLGGIDRKRNN